MQNLWTPHFKTRGKPYRFHPLKLKHRPAPSFLRVKNSTTFSISLKSDCSEKKWSLMQKKKIMFSLHPIPLASSRLIPLTLEHIPAKDTSLMVTRIFPLQSNQQTYTDSVIVSITFGDLALISIFILLCSSPNDVIFFSTLTSLNKDHYMCANIIRMIHLSFR